MLASFKLLSSLSKGQRVLSIQSSFSSSIISTNTNNLVLSSRFASKIDPKKAVKVVKEKKIKQIVDKEKQSKQAEKDKLAKQAEKERNLKKAKSEKEKLSIQKQKEKERIKKEKLKELNNKKKLKLKAEAEKKEVIVAKKAELKKKEKEKKDARPVRPKTGYLYFIKKNYESTKKANPSKSATELMTLFSEKWNKLSETEKKPYNDDAKKDRIRYEKEVAEVKKNAPPKRPLSSYMIFGKEERPKILKENPKLDVTEVAKKIGERWGKLSATEKQKYTNISNKAKEEFDKKYKKEVKQ